MSYPTAITAVEFSGNRLDLVPGLDLYNHDFNKLPGRDIKKHKLARRNLSIVTSAEYVDKDIPVWFEIDAGTRQASEATVIDVKALLSAQNGSLRVLQGGVWTNYVATLNEFNIEWDGPHAYCEVHFLASNPVGSTVDAVSLVNINGITASSASATFSVDGSANAEPIITVIIKAVTGGTNGQLSVINALNNQGITITSNFAVNDIIEINCREYTVQKNGANLDFAGLFPSFGPGVQQLAYSDTFTTRNVDLSSVYNARTV